MKETRHKVGRVLLGKFDGGDKFEVRWRDRQTEKYVRRRLDFTKFADAKAFAEDLNVKLIRSGGSLEGTGDAVARKRIKKHTVSQAALEAGADGRTRNFLVFCYFFKRHALIEVEEDNGAIRQGLEGFCHRPRRREQSPYSHRRHRN